MMGLSFVGLEVSLHNLNAFEIVQTCTLALTMRNFAQKHHLFPLFLSLYSKASPKNTSEENPLAYYFY